MNTRILIPIFVILAVLFGACGMDINIDVDRGSGNIITQTREVSNFDRVLLSGIGDVTIIQGEREALEIEAEDNIIPRIQTEVADGTLTISFDRKAVIPTRTVRFTLTMRDIHSLETKGVSNIQSDAIRTDSLELGISGTGNIDIRNLEAERVSVIVSGAGNLNAEGNVSEQQVTMSGAGNYNGEDLQSRTAEIIITGLGRATVWVSDSLDVTISGTGGVDYFGSPQVEQQISGLGRLKHMGSK